METLRDIGEGKGDFSSPSRNDLWKRNFNKLSVPYYKYIYDYGLSTVNVTNKAL